MKKTVDTIKDGAGLLLFCLAVLGPILALLFQTLQDVLEGHLTWLSLVIPDGRQLTLFLRSLGLSASVGSSSILIGGLAASLLWQWETRAGKIVRWLLLVLAPLPPYIHALAWSTLFSGFNTLLRGAGLAEVMFRGWPASWWVQTMAFLPIAVGLGLIGFKMIDPDLLRAARLHGDDGYWLYRVAVPLASPMILAAGGAAFILSLVDYSVPSLFQMNVYSLEIFAEFSAQHEPSRAFLLALPLWLLASLVLLVTFAPKRFAALTPAWRASPSTPPVRFPAWVRGLQYAAIGVLAGQFLIPVASQAALVKTWGTFREAIGNAASEIQVSTWVALGAALACLPLAAYAGVQLMSKQRYKLWWALVLLPVAQPASLVGIGLIAVWNHPGLPRIYGTLAMPVLAALARFTPFAVLAVLAQMGTLRSALIDAMTIYQKNPLEGFFKIQLPLYAPGLAAGAAIVFILTMGELGATLIVAPPGMGTITMRIYNYLHYGASDTVAGLCLGITLVTVLVGGAAVLLLNLRSGEQRDKTPDA